MESVIIPYCSAILLCAYCLATTSNVAFQGSCADRNVLCEQLCIAISQEVYECGCYSGHVLVDDGTKCVASRSHEPSQTSDEIPIEQYYSSVQDSVFSPFIGNAVPLPVDDPDQAVSTTTSATTEKTLKVAQFDGDSYAKLDAPRDIDEYVELSISLKPNEPEGMVYQHGSTSSHHLMVYLEDGYVNVQLCLGGDRIVARSALPLTMRSWHKLRIWRTGRAVLIKVDRQPWVEDRVSSNVQFANRTRFIFLGGAPPEQVPAAMRQHSGFSGCIKRVHYNGHPMDITSDSLTLHNVHECGWQACAEVQCGHQATCVDAHAVPVCMCPYPMRGQLCQHEFSTPPSSMKFSRHSYLRFADQRIMKHITGETTHISFDLKRDLKRDQNYSTDPNIVSQVLLYASDEQGLGDQLRLLLTNESYLELNVDLGSGLATLSHPTTLLPAIWYNITLHRLARHLSISVDSVKVSTLAPSPSQELNVYDAFYVGGNSEHEVNTSGFEGCIRRLRIGHEQFSLASNSTEAINIDQC